LTPIPVIVDCDPGHDDAIALMLAAASPEIDLLGVTTVAGNTTIDKTTRNALAVLELIGRTDVPVAMGSDVPLERNLVTAEHVHGSTGLDGPELHNPPMQPHELGAVSYLARTLAASDRRITLIPVGPLTNIAMLISAHPDLVEGIERIVLMGGAINLGNITPAAEFNIFVDPEAADLVFRSGLDITMIGLDVTHQARLTTDHADQLRPSGPAGAFVADLLDYFVPNYQRRMGFTGAPIHDALAVAYVIWPDLVETGDYSVEVDTSDGPSAGRTLVDRFQVTGRAPNARVGTSVDSEQFSGRLLERISSLDDGPTG
jgi:inosine-uridine nucleoside N-ribohydrolase